MNIGQFARKCIQDNPSMKNEDILKLVQAQFPAAKTSYACIAWYKSDMKKKGVLVKPRTAEVVMAEIDALQAKLDELNEELLVKMQEEDPESLQDEELEVSNQPQEEEESQV